MIKGYQVIEPETIGAIFSNPNQHSVVVALLSWAIDKLMQKSPELYKSVTIEVIAVTYHGTYPAIGVHYGLGDKRDLGAQISTSIDAIVEQASLKDFVSFLESSEQDWGEVWKELRK